LLTFVKPNVRRVSTFETVRKGRGIQARMPDPRPDLSGTKASAQTGEI